MTHPSWVALHGMAHKIIELDKVVVHVINLALTRCTDFFALGHGVQRGGCEALLVAWRRELAGEGEQVSAHATNLVFEECDMTNLSEIQTGESAFCRNIQAYPLPQVSNTSGFFTLP